VSLRHPRWARHRLLVKVEIMLSACIIMTVLLWVLYVIHSELMRTRLPFGLQ
jgi:hypothetical protein